MTGLIDVHATSSPIPTSSQPLLAADRPGPTAAHSRVHLRYRPRAVTDLILAGNLQGHPELSVIVPHGGALPLADGIKAFLLASPAHGGPAPDVVAQLRGLHYDLADTRSPVRFRRC